MIAAFLMVLAFSPTDDAALMGHLLGRVAASYDTAQGGFLERRGAPKESAVELALSLGPEAGPQWRARGLATINWTRGLFDSVGGGFVESHKDADPSEPMFDKRTTSNARRLENLTQAWRVTGEAEYKEDALFVIDYFERVLMDGRGGFIAGQVGDRELFPAPNGVAIRAWLAWAIATRDRRFCDFALTSLDRTWNVCWDARYGLLRKGVFGEPLRVPQLEDQVEMGRALVLGARLVDRAIDLQRARVLGDHLLERYLDPAKGGFASQAIPAKENKFKRSGRDSELNAHAVRFLAELATLTGESKYRDAARRATSTWAPKLEKAGLEAADWALALRALTTQELAERPRWIAHEEPPAKPKKRFSIRVRK